ncbi:sensor histidine kinase [Paenibacillus gansuensis]|uniref:histidine kinase n=1 Tax=Paenibacillus gansuensis TaxID=306542 RepID=A0ABW5P7L2_9BACL
MSYKQIKWLIMAVPTLTIGLWEYIRHNVLTSYISMGLGNWLAPLLVFLVTVAFLLKLFDILEDAQEQLEAERAEKAVLEEREKLARELHDGISQSLFLLSVKMDKLEREQPAVKETGTYHQLRRTIRKVYEDVRQSIANLKVQATPEELPWRQSLEGLLREFTENTGVDAELSWKLEEEHLTPKEKVELLACIREGMMNVQKHAKASKAWLNAGMSDYGGWECTVTDDGQGFGSGSPGVIQSAASNFGLGIIEERCASMGWACGLERTEGRTTLWIRKEGKG